MTTINDLLFFLKYIFPLLILAFGLIGNTLGLIVLKKKDLSNIGPKNTYMYLFVTDSFYLLQIIVVIFQYGSSYNLQIISNLSCKMWNFFNYSLASVSSWLIVYISAERCVSLLKPAWRFTFRKKSIQLAWFIFVIVACLLYYIPVGIYYKGFPLTDNSTTPVICDFVDADAINLISYMDLVLRVLLPFFLMIISSLTLAYSLLKSRQRIVKNFLTEEEQTFKKEIKLAASSIGLNLIYIVTQLPVSITIFGSQYYSSAVYIFTYYLFYASYSVNFYIVLATNSLFRAKFLSLFKKS